MSQAVRDLVDAAAAGRPVYISSLRERFDALAALGSPSCSSRAWTASTRRAGSSPSRCRSSARSLADERAMVTEYVLAGLYNIISTLGGRGLALEAEGDDGEGAELAAAFEREFGIGAAPPAAARVRPGRQRLGADGRGHLARRHARRAAGSGLTDADAAAGCDDPGAGPPPDGHRGAVRARPPSGMDGTVDLRHGHRRHGHQALPRGRRQGRPVHRVRLVPGRVHARSTRSSTRSSCSSA